MYGRKRKSMRYTHGAVVAAAQWAKATKPARPAPLTALWLVCLLAAGCGRAYLGPPTDTPEGQLEGGRRLLEEERYYDAITELEAFTSQNPGSGLLDTALFYLGEAYLGRRDYPMAASEFERLLREFPGSGHASVARYRLGVAYFEQSPAAELDPTMTERALEQLRLFMKLHPQSEHVADAQAKVEELRAKLAKKHYLNGNLYIRLKEAAASRFYFGIVVGEYADTAWAPLSILGLARSYEIEEKPEMAIEQYKKLLKSYPGSDGAAQARARLRELGAGVAGLEDGAAGDDERDSTHEEEP